MLHRVQMICPGFKLLSLRPLNGDWGVMEAPVHRLLDLYDVADQTLFTKILNNTNHVLYPLLPPIKPTIYNLRTRIHNHCLPLNDTSMSHNFLEICIKTPIKN